MDYDLELERAVEEIKKANAKNVVLQLPDGLKSKATEVASYLKKNTDANILIWLNSCYGACDIPLELNSLNIDLLIQFGHSKWMFE
jgi:2-(3-amino-3-carboxypropyl)histidine synthase